MADESKTYNLQNLKRRSRSSGSNPCSYQPGDWRGELIKRSGKGRASSLSLMTRINKYRMNKKLNGPFLVSRTGDVG